MNTDIYDPAAADASANGDMKDAITMTPAAHHHVRRQLAKEGAEALELGVKTSGCNGYMYDLAYREAGAEAVPGDRVFDFDGVRVLVAHGNWPLVRGTAIDYVAEGLNAMLTFSNPNATGQCGCGESFSVTAPLGAGPEAEGAATP